MRPSRITSNVSIKKDALLLINYLRSTFTEPLFVSLFRKSMFKYWRAFENSQYYSQNDLVQNQNNLFLLLLNYVLTNNAFYINKYRYHDISIQSVKSLNDIAKLPLVTKSEIRSNLNLLISKPFDKNHLLHFKTGGSTGKALDLYITEDCSSRRNACARRHDRWTGWKPGEPIAAVWGNPDLPKTIKANLKNLFISPIIFLDTMAMNIPSVNSFLFNCQKKKATLLFGHAHSIYLLAQYVSNFELQAFQPKGILSTSMMLYPHERSLIEKTFGCKVIDRYGCEEVGLIGCECSKHEGMHLNIDNLIIEFLNENGFPAKPGEPGQIVLTDLSNIAMPLIRYKVEDIGIPLEIQCSCGRGLPLMQKVIGRTADFLIKDDGTKVAGISLIENTLTKLSGINQMQIIQNSLYEFQLNIVPDLIYSDTVSIDLASYFSKIFPGSRTDIHLVKQIPPEPNGKFRFSICNVHSL